MTADEYIELSKALFPTWKSRYIDGIKETFLFLTQVPYLKHPNAKKVDLKIISSNSFFSEVIYTTSNYTLIWDNFQWELIEKFLISSLIYINNKKDLAINIYKANIYYALSIHLTDISPELSYVFAEHCMDAIIEQNLDYYALVSKHMFDDLFYAQILSLGHELAHIIFDQPELGKKVYRMKEADFLSVMSVAQRFNFFKSDSTIVTFDKLFNAIKSDSNRKYREELICDIFSYDLVSDFIIDLDREICNKKEIEVRKIESLYDDILSIYDFVIKTLNTFTFLLEIWTRTASISTTRRCVKIEDFHANKPNLSIWKDQFLAREHLVSLYMRLVITRDQNIVVSDKNKKYFKMYNAIHEMTIETSSGTDKDFFNIVNEFQYLLTKNIPKHTLINERNKILGLE